MNADGTGQVRLTRNNVQDHSPAWSPDGRKIAFVSEGPDGKGDIYVMDSDGTTLVRLTSSAAREIYPEWSSDGRRIAFEADGEGNREIYLMEADGTRREKLIKPNTF